MDKVHERRLKQHDRVLNVLHQISFPGVMLEEVKFPFHDGSARSVEDVDGLVTRALLARHDNQALLENMSLDELTAKEGELMEQYLAIPHTDLEALKEQQYFFNRPEAEADCQDLVTMPYWTVDEAVAYSYRKNPAKVTAERLASLIGVLHSFPGEYANRVERAKRAIHAGDLCEPIRPTDFANWANGVGIECPTDLSTSAAVISTPAVQGRPVFSRQENLDWDEITLTLLGSGLIEVSACDLTKKVPLADLGLLNRSTNQPNSGFVLLAALAESRQSSVRVKPALKNITHELRKSLKSYFGIATNPLATHGGNYSARFGLIDKRDAADERAKKKALRKTVSFDEDNPAHQYQSETVSGGDSDEYPHDDETDATAEWLEENGN